MTELAKKKNDVVKCGRVICVHCHEVVPCRQMEKHGASRHPEQRGFCIFCGSFRITRNKSGLRMLPEAKEHFINCAKEAKRIFKAAIAKAPPVKPQRPAYSESDVVSSRFIGGQHDTPVDSLVLLLHQSADVFERRRLRFAGEEARQIAVGNTQTEDALRVREFWQRYNFAVPPWIESLIAGAGLERILVNRLEFHESYNIDTVWAKVFGMPQLVFYHAFVQMCVFERFRQLIETHADKCAILRYACLNYKHGRVLVHFVVVALRSAHIQHYFNNGNLDCDITVERRHLSKLMKDEGMRIVPSWPDHRHFFMKTIFTDMHLFYTLRYISTRDTPTTAPITVERSQAYEVVLNVHSEKQCDIRRRVDTLIERYVLNVNTAGSRFYIFRPLSDDAPLWFAAVSRAGLYSFVRFAMDRRSLIDELDKVKDGGFIEYRHILQYLPLSAIPLRDGDVLYHANCTNITERDPERYINLGRNEYMYLAARGTVPCDHYSKDVFFANLPDSRYKLTHKQRHEHDIYTKWTNLNKNIEI